MVLIYRRTLDFQGDGSGRSVESSRLQWIEREIAGWINRKYKKVYKYYMGKNNQIINSAITLTRPEDFGVQGGVYCKYCIIIDSPVS